MKSTGTVAAITTALRHAHAAAGVMNGGVPPLKGWSCVNAGACSDKRQQVVLLMAVALSHVAAAAQRPLLTPVTLTHTTDVVAAAGAAVRAAVARRHRTMVSFDNFVPKIPA